MFLRISSAKNLFHRWPLKCVAKDGNNVSAKLTSAYAEFREHCRMLRESPLVKRFTRENLGWGSTKTYPKCSFKGSDTRLILGFLIGALEKPEVQLDEVTSVAYVAAKSMDDFLRLVFGTKDGQGCRKSLFNRNEGAHALALLTVWCEKIYLCHSVLWKAAMFFSADAKVSFFTPCRCRLEGAAVKDAKHRSLHPESRTLCHADGRRCNGAFLPHGSNLPRPDCQCAGGPKMAHRNQTLLG